MSIGIAFARTNAFKKGEDIVYQASPRSLVGEKYPYYEMGVAENELVLRKINDDGKVTEFFVASVHIEHLIEVLDKAQADKRTQTELFFVPFR